MTNFTLHKLRNILGAVINPATSDNQTNWTQKSKIVDEDWNIAIIDEFSQSLVNMNQEHHVIRIGNAYSMDVYSTVVNWTPKYCQFKTGAKYIHLKEKWIVNGTDTLLCTLFEAPTVTDWTTPIVPLNKNRNSTNTSSMTIYSNPTAISGGTIMEYDYLSGAVMSSALMQRSTNEWILKPNTNYVYKLECLSVWTATFLSKLFWYEVT